jgi:iron complex outermembrane receptor protein
MQASYTLLHSEDRSDDPARRGQPLPGRPRHDVFVRWSAGPTFWAKGVSIEPRVFYTVDYIAGTFLDPSGRFELPPRAIQGVGTEVHFADAVHLAVEVRNLLDVRTAFVTLPVAAARPQRVAVSDFIGFPLPGRSVWATLRIDTDPRAWSMRE